MPAIQYKVLTITIAGRDASYTVQYKVLNKGKAQYINIVY